jgi:hypothetical protein
MIEMQHGANSDTDPATTAATTDPPKKMLVLFMDGVDGHGEPVDLRGAERCGQARKHADRKRTGPRYDEV